MARPNPVAKFQQRFNKAKTFKDRKRDLKKGHRKHKQPWREQ